MIVSVGCVHVVGCVVFLVMMLLLLVVLLKVVVVVVGILVLGRGVL